MTARFRFGVQLFGSYDGRTWADAARRAEDQGYASLFLPDHFDDQLAPLPALVSAADATTTLRVGSLVLDNDYRHPVMLAKEAATVDVLTGGRLELGLGAGWQNTDYERSGITKERDGVRIAKLAEAITILRGLWAEGSYSYAGEHYTITELNGLPKPVQRPVPLLIGGGGPKVLGLAAREADIVGINPAIPKGFVDASVAPELAPEAVDRKIGIVRDAAGDRFAGIELNILVFACNVGAGADAHREGTAAAMGLSPGDLDASPYVWVGEPAAVADQLRAIRERYGTSYFVLQGKESAEAAAPVVEELAGT